MQLSVEGQLSFNLLLCGFGAFLSFCTETRAVNRAGEVYRLAAVSEIMETVNVYM